MENNFKKNWVKQILNAVQSYLLNKIKIQIKFSYHSYIKVIW